MKKTFYSLLALCFIALLPSCTLIEDGFKAGVIFTIIIVVIIGVIIWAVRFSAEQIGKKYRVETIPVRNKKAIREV